MKGEEIPVAARIFAIADVWDAVTTDRPYRRAMSYEKAIEVIKEGAGTHFDPAVVDLFLEYLEENNGNLVAGASTEDPDPEKVET